MDSFAQPATSVLAPFLIAPQFVERVWGWNDLRPWYDWSGGPTPIGEVWLTGDECRVATGELTGRRLAEVFTTHSAPMLGSTEAEATSPLLLKVIFAKDKLSVQVHPDDAMGQRYGFPRGKTECWYVLDAEPGAEIACGLKPGTTVEAVKASLENNSLEGLLEMLPADKGTMFFVDSGTVHAIWPGSVLLETQQYSDLTYRLYDYGRPRPLHIEQSFEALRLKNDSGIVPPVELGDRTRLIEARYFRVERVPVIGSRTRNSLEGTGGARLSYLYCAAGRARIEGECFEAFELPAHGIAAVPAWSPEFAVVDLGGLELVRVAVA